MMPEVLEKLLVLQDRDQKMRRLRNELTGLPGERETTDRRLAQAQATLDEKRKATRENEMRRHSLEVDVQTKQTAIAKLKTQMMDTRKNDEYQAFIREIARSQETIVGLEDSQLELMEAAETLKAELKEAEKAFAEAKRIHGEQIALQETKRVTLSAQLATIEAARGGLITGIPAEHLDRFERLMKTKKDMAIAGVIATICSGCHMKIPPTSISKARQSVEIAHCDNCGRMIHFVE